MKHENIGDLFSDILSETKPKRRENYLAPFCVSILKTIQQIN